MSAKKRPRRTRRPEGRNWERDSYGHQPWNNPGVEMRLYVAPWIKEKLGLACKTTVEYLERINADRGAKPS